MPFLVKSLQILYNTIWLIKSIQYYTPHQAILEITHVYRYRSNLSRKIQNSRVYDVARITPLELQNNLSKRIHNKVLLKREDMQPVFSFKIRGAYNKMAHLPRKRWPKV